MESAAKAQTPEEPLADLLSDSGIQVTNHCVVADFKKLGDISAYVLIKQALGDVLAILCTN